MDFILCILIILIGIINNMESRVNTEGLRVHNEVLRALKDYKQGALLEGAYFTIQFSITNELMMTLRPGVVDDQIRIECIQAMAKAMVKKYRYSVEAVETDKGIDYSMQAIMLPLPDFKHIVEYAIRTMPEEALKEIRNTIS